MKRENGTFPAICLYQMRVDHNFRCGRCGPKGIETHCVFHQHACCYIKRRQPKPPQYLSRHVYLYVFDVHMRQCFFKKSNETWEIKRFVWCLVAMREKFIKTGRWWLSLFDLNIHTQHTYVYIISYKCNEECIFVIRWVL